MMNYRIEISPLPQWSDARGEGVKKQIVKFLNFPVEKVLSRDVYTVSGSFSEKEVRQIAALLYNPVLQGWRVGAATSENFQSLPPCDFLIRVGFKPGVTDNVGPFRPRRDQRHSRASTPGGRACFQLHRIPALRARTRPCPGRCHRLETAGQRVIQSVLVMSGEEASNGFR